MSDERIINIVGFGSATLVDDTGDYQLFQVTEGAAGTGYKDRVTDKVIRLTEFGFSSNPPLGAQVMLLRRNGERGATIVISTAHKDSRPKNLKPGDAILYDVRGAHVLLTDTGIEIDAAGLDVTVKNAANISLQATTKVTIDAPDVECTGNLKVDKLLTGDGTPVELGALRDAYNSHTHGGVKSGSDTSSGPEPTV